MLFQTKKEVSPWSFLFQNTALKAKEREKARQEEMVKRQQADKARALKKAKKETGVRQ